MYRLREFEPADLQAIEHKLPAHAEAATAVRHWPGGLRGIVVTDPSGGFAGFLIATSHRLTTDTRTIGLGIVRLAHVTETARIGGIHSLLHEMDGAFAESFEGADKAYQAMIAQWHEQDIWCLRRLRDYEPIAQSLTFEGMAFERAAPRPFAPQPFTPQPGDAGEVTVGPLTAAAVASDCSPAFDEGPTIGMQRSAAMLQHAASQPGRTAWLTRRGRQVLGWAVTRQQGPTTVLEDHWINWQDADIAQHTLAAISAHGQRLRTTRWTNQEAEIANLQTAGLRLRGPEQLLAARVSAFGIAPANLAQFASLGEADVGRAALPRMSHNERIVTPPPPGTQNTRGDHRRSSANRKFQAR